MNHADDNDNPDGWAARIAAVTAQVDPLDSGLIERSIGSLLRVVREQLQLEVVFVGEFVDGNRVFRHIATRSGEPLIAPGDFHPADQTICQRIVDGRLPAVLNDVASVRTGYGLPRFYDGIGGYIGVPVRLADGTLYGVLCGFSFRPAPQLQPRDVRRLEMAAQATARLIAQAEGRDVEPADAGR